LTKDSKKQNKKNERHEPSNTPQGEPHGLSNIAPAKTIEGAPPLTPDSSATQSTTRNAKFVTLLVNNFLLNGGAGAPQLNE